MATRPPIFKNGDTIGLVTLGSPILNETSINIGVQYLKNLGYNVILGKSVFSSSGIVAAPAKQRAEELMNMFRDQSVNMILATRGGTGVQTILPELDFEFIKSHPKIVSGYSDITVLLNSLYQFSDMISFHSLMVPDFRDNTPSYNIDQFFEATTTKTFPRLIQNPPNLTITPLVPGNVTGPIVGGNLTSIVNTLGTPFEIDTRGKIIFIEETHAPSNTIYRQFTQLLQSGKFKDSIGIIVGQCNECLISYGTTFNDLVSAMLIPLGKPLISNLATGHGYYKATIPIGANVLLNATDGVLSIQEPSVS